MLINMVSPQEGFNSSRNSITVTGYGFVPSDAIVCQVGLSEGPCTFLSPTSLACTLPSHPLPSVQIVDITVSGDALGLLPVAGNSTAFTFYSTAPQLTHTHFTPSYAQLIVVFDREVEIGGEAEPNADTPPLCETVFVSGTLQLLGNHSTCKWLNVQQRAVVVSIYGTSTVVVGDSIQLRADVFRTRHVQFSRLSQQQSIRVGSPPGEPPFRPIAIITGKFSSVTHRTVLLQIIHLCSRHTHTCSNWSYYTLFCLTTNVSWQDLCTVYMYVRICMCVYQGSQSVSVDGESLFVVVATCRAICCTWVWRGGTVWGLLTQYWTTPLGVFVGC